MTKDLYSRLGVAKSASAADITKAFRAAAKSCHPDLHPGDGAKEARFKSLSQAHEILSDPDKRARYDRGEIDENGQEQMPFGAGGPGHGGHGFAGGFSGRGPGGASWQGMSGAEAEDLFADLFGRAGFAGGGFGSGGFAGDGFAGAGRGRTAGRGADRRYSLEIDFLDAARGATKRLDLPEGGTLDVKIPAGLRDGQVLRLKGKGGAGPGGRDRGAGPGGRDRGAGPGGANGDALITVGVRPHPRFRRDGDHVESDLPISLKEAVLGGKVPVETVHGTVSLTVPPGASSGDRLRLKEKGIRAAGRPAGHHTVRLQVVLPAKPDAELKAFIERWAKDHDYDPRKDR